MKLFATLLLLQVHGCVVLDRIDSVSLQYCDGDSCVTGKVNLKPVPKSLK